MSQTRGPQLSTSGSRWIVVIAGVVLIVAVVQAVIGSYFIAALSGAVGVLLLVLGRRIGRLTQQAQEAINEESALR
jgi:Flp pilus assembly protein TadB